MSNELQQKEVVEHQARKPFYKKSWFFIPLAIVLAGGLIGAAMDEQPSNTSTPTAISYLTQPPPTPVQPSTPIQPTNIPAPTDSTLATQNSGWQEFNAPNGSFKILFQTLPTHTQKYSGTNDFPFYGEMYRTEGDNLQYFVEYVDYSKMDTSDPDSFLNMSMNGLASQPGSYVIDSRFSYLGSHRMLDFQIGTKIGHILARAIMDGSMLYIMGVMGNTPNLPQSDYEKFIYSFKITR